MFLVIPAFTRLIRWFIRRLRTRKAATATP